jgi:Tol biopolymer transport system component
LANAEFTRLTDWEGDELDAAISPDGRLAAFLSARDGIFDAWVSQVGSGTFVNLTKGQFPALVHDAIRSVGFSGDGAYVWLRVVDPNSPGGQAGGGVWIVPAMAGGAPRPFLSAASNVSWSPDGARIAYFDSAPGDPIYIADRNGSNAKLLFDDKPAGHLHFPTWSPDGRFVYFQRGPATTNRQDIWRIPAAGGQPERVTFHDARVKYPALLDGRTLVYTAVAADGSGPWLYTTDVETKVARRISYGVERYTSVSATSDGFRLAATVSNPSASLWTVPLAGSAQAESAAARLPLPTVSAGSPRSGPGYLLYLSSSGVSEGLWKFQANLASELWSGSNGAVAAAPAVSPDGKRLCVPVLKQGRGTLHLMTADGTDARTIAESLDVRQAPSWSPDGNWIAVAASDAGEAAQNSRIFLVPVNGKPPVRVTETLSHGPVWSPNGRMIVYGRQRQGASVQLAAVTPDKKEVPLPEVFVSVVGDRFRFLPDGSGLVVMQGEFRRLNFWHLDLKSGQRRQITALKPGSLLRSFDISPDGKQIVFDRIQENTDVVLINRKR